MTRQLVRFALAAAAVLTLAGCETASQQSETVTWNTPRPEPAQPPAAGTQSPPLTTPQAAAPAQPECREYQTTVTIDGKPQKAYGKACRQPDGTWKQVGTVSTTPPPQAQAGEQSFPYGWYGYDYPIGPRFGPGTSLGVGIGTGSHGTGGFMGWGIGF